MYCGAVCVCWVMTAGICHWNPAVCIAMQRNMSLANWLNSCSFGWHMLLLPCYYWTGLDWTGLNHLHCWRSMTWLSDTIVLHSSRSCAILVHSATDDPIQSLMSSVHRLLGRPRRFLPLIQPWRTAVHRLSALAVCQKLQFLSLNVLQKSRFFSDFFQNGLVCSVLFPADPQHASIWCHFKGANPFPVAGLQGPCLATM